MIQRNAIRSWTHLGEQAEVLLVGDEKGLEETAGELGVGHLAKVKRNPWGTPLVSSIFEMARQNSRSPILAYLNADILVMPDFVETARDVADQSEEFLIIGRRWDLDVRKDLDFGPRWFDHLRAQVEAHGHLHAPAGSDFFVFPRHAYGDMPDFAIGRAGWDNWAIYKACQSGWAVIDATDALMVVHQDHDYSHLPGGQAHYDLEESTLNANLAGGRAHMYTVLDANKTFANGRIRNPSPTVPRVLRRLEVLLMDGKKQGLRWFMLRRVRRLRRRVTGTL